MLEARKTLDPQANRAKTCMLPKDFREELRKFQALKAKIEERSQEDSEKRRSRHEMRDCVTVSTLGLNRDSGHNARPAPNVEVQDAEETK